MKALALATTLAPTLVGVVLLHSAEPAPELAKPEPAAAAPLIIDPKLFAAEPQPNGYSWTLASREGDMLHLAETMFGPRDPSYTFVGIEFVADVPRVWYPGNRKFIAIQLHTSAAHDMSHACYQLAHETVHLLAPTGGGGATNFEEGLADYFASYYMRTKMNQPKWHSPLASYRKASSLIAPHLDQTPDAIRRLRTVQPALSSLTAEAIAAEFTDLSLEDAAFLARRFVRQ